VSGFTTDNAILGNIRGWIRLCDTQNRWRGVCEDGWDATDAMVACRQLGYSTGKTCAYINNVFTEPAGKPGHAGTAAMAVAI
jgi:hypothetical protein